MNFKKFKLIQQYNRVLLWNEFAGKKVNDSPFNQIERVREEISELNVTTSVPIGNDYERKVLLVDDLADIFVTAAFLDNMNYGGTRCSVYGYDTNEIVDELLMNQNYHEIKTIITVDNALKIVSEMALSECNESFDLLGAIEHVMDSNFSKYIPRGAKNWLDIALKQFESEGVDVYVEDSQLYHAVKRVGDDKIMKPTVCYRPPALEKFVKV